MTICRELTLNTKTCIPDLPLLPFTLSFFFSDSVENKKQKIETANLKSDSYIPVLIRVKTPLTECMLPSIRFFTSHA